MMEKIPDALLSQKIGSVEENRESDEWSHSYTGARKRRSLN